MASQPFPSELPRTGVPTHAWSWLQRSRSVLGEITQQLYGAAGDQALLDRLKADYAADLFVQDLVARVVCDVAFHGRVPDRCPVGTRWDRGLTWWAAHLAGVSSRDFEARSRATTPPQQVLFGPVPAPDNPPPVPQQTRRKPLVSIERRAMVQALRDLLVTGDGDSVPADAVRALIQQLQADDTPQS